ncbi:MAG TPA: hypothetical protein PK371_03345, partial [Bacteroidales bacterium]|nr:hypothetical protein [Bacteroidales bacterium]
MLIDTIKNLLSDFFALYGIDPEELKITSTEPPHTGDFTFYLFPLLKKTKLNPEELSTAITQILYDKDIIKNHEIIKGFLNVSLSDKF